MEQIQKTRLLSRAQQGDADALDALVRAYYPEILHYCRSAQKDGPPLETLPEEPAYQEAGFAQTEEELSLRAMTARLEPEQRELVLLLRRVRPERLVLTVVPLFAGQLVLLQLMQEPEPALPPLLPLAVWLGWQCAKLASRPEWAAE